MIGAGTLRAVPRHVWTAEHIYPPLSADYQALRASAGKSRPPLAVIVTRSGDLDLSLPVFSRGETPVLVVTSPAGQQRLSGKPLPPTVRVAAVTPGADGGVRAGEILRSVSAALAVDSPLILHEGGPLLMGEFFGERAIDELFITLAPQVAGRADDGQTGARPGLVSGRALAPWNPVWGRLLSVKRSGSHLFLRYQFERGQPTAP
jgi:riboflavin biosynthesis pyrimidine reductase